jgi:CDP-6-deoxy-D-xylo-4-hexulose-3-dehydrase
MGKQPFWIKKYGQTSLEVADIVHDYGLYLPNHLYLDEEKIKFVCDKFKEVAIPKFF